MVTENITGTVWLVSSYVGRGNIVLTIGIFNRIDSAIQACMPFDSINTITSDVIECKKDAYTLRITRHILQ